MRLTLRYFTREIGPVHYVVDIVEPTQVTDLTFFLLPGSPVPPGFGGALMYPCGKLKCKLFVYL